MSASRLIARTRYFMVSIVLVLFAACEESTEPILPGGITLVSGDNQYSKFGTELADPLVVQVRLSDGSPAAGVAVKFAPTEGGGSVTVASVRTNVDGVASTRFFLGSTAIVNKVRASVSDDADLNVDFSATAGAFFCTEQDPTFAQKYFPILFGGGVLLFTRESSLNTQGLTTVAGIVSMSTSFDAGPDTLIVETQSIARWDDDFLISVPVDLAFSAAGDLYGVWKADDEEVVKIAPGGIDTHFAQAVPLSEIATAPKGILVGVDKFGLFSVGCRDSLERYQAARFSGMGIDAANDDAIAVHPAEDDAYFIYFGDNSLYRLPIDSLTATGPIEHVVSLTADEAEGANGMAVDDDGNIYILVDTDNTKALLKVVGSVKTVFFDFFTRGPGDAAGIQNDLAINDNGTLLYTLDTLNNKLLLLREPLPRLQEASARTTGELSSPSSGERVGLAWIPTN